MSYRFLVAGFALVALASSPAPACRGSDPRRRARRGLDSASDSVG